jgi:hypothetical protein
MHNEQYSPRNKNASSQILSNLPMYFIGLFYRKDSYECIACTMDCAGATDWLNKQLLFTRWIWLLSERGVPHSCPKRSYDW